MSCIYSISNTPLHNKFVLEILQSPAEGNVSDVPPVKPKGGEIYVYRSKNQDCQDDWRCDQYRWVNQGVHKLPKRHPVINKIYFQIDTTEGPSVKFVKHAYRLLHNTNTTLIHYMGDEKYADEFPHRSKIYNGDRKYVRTCPSVLKNIKKGCIDKRSLKIYKSQVTATVPLTHMPVLQARNLKQVQNLRYRQLHNKRRISRDALYNTQELAIDLPDFIHLIHIHPDLVCVFGQKKLLDELDNLLLLKSPLSPQLLSYDTTFQLGDFYLSVLSFRHIMFKEAPVIPAIFLLHERKFQEHHEVFFHTSCKLIPSLKKMVYPIVTDAERSIVNAITNILPQAVQLRCWNHLFRDVKRWLRDHGAQSQDVTIYHDEIKNLLHLPNEKDYDEVLATKKFKWSAPFLEYYMKNIHKDIHAIARWTIEKYDVYSLYSGVTNNQAEAMNSVIKDLQDRQESPQDVMLLSLYNLQNYYITEIIRGQNGLGNYHLYSQYSDLAYTENVPNRSINSPSKIVARIRERISTTTSEIKAIADLSQVPINSLTQVERAERIISEKKIAFDPILHTFTVLGASNKPHALTLFPSESCTCPSTVNCYHILAAKMSIGLKDDKSNKKKMNLTQLRRNERSRREKKSGRKIPRSGDLDILPAPDAMQFAHTLADNAPRKQLFKSNSISEFSGNNIYDNQFDHNIANAEKQDNYIKLEYPHFASEENDSSISSVRLQSRVDDNVCDKGILKTKRNEDVYACEARCTNQTTCSFKKDDHNIANAEKQDNYIKLEYPHFASEENDSSVSSVRLQSRVDDNVCDKGSLKAKRNEDVYTCEVRYTNQ